MAGKFLSSPNSKRARGAVAVAAADADVAVVIINYRTPELAIECLAALRVEKRNLPKLRVIVADGGSGDDSVAQIMAASMEPSYTDWVSVLPLAINGGFGWANNQAILELAQGPQPPEYIYLLNADAQVTEGATAALVGELRHHPECGAAGSLLLSPDGNPAASAFRFPSPGRELICSARSEKLGRLLGIAPVVVAEESSTAVDWVSGASVMVRAEALRSAGLFDDGFFLYFEEVELMHRLTRKGWTIRHVPDSKVVHIEGASTGVGAKETALPPYWYYSRQRYFALTGGRGLLVAANLARFAGLAIGAAKGLGQSARPPAHYSARTPGKRPQQITPSFPAWGDAPGKTPAWMAGQ